MYKVLVIAYYFPPMGLSGVQRTLKFVKYMKNYNWEPTVITTGNVAYFAHDNSLLKESEEAGIRVIRTEGKDPNSVLAKFGTVKIPGEFVRKLFNRISQTFFIPDNKKSWSKKAYTAGEKLLVAEKYDLIFVTGPPFSAFITASKLKKKFNLPLVVDYRDMWYDSYLAFYPTPVHKYLNKKWEYNSLKAADKIIVTNRKIKERIINTFQFLTFEDLTIISHGYDPEDFENSVPIPKSTKKMILTYSGIFYEHNTPKYLFKAFKKLSIERPDITSNIELNFIGLLGKDNKKLIKKLKLEEYIKDFGYLNHSDAVQKIVSSDVLWMMLGNWKYNDSILPGKLYEYFGSHKAFIACLPEGAARMAAKEYGAAFITDPDNIDQIKDTIKQVYELYTKDELPKANEEFVSKHRRDFLTEQLTKQFQFLIKEEVV